MKSKNKKKREKSVSGLGTKRYAGKKIQSEWHPYSSQQENNSENIIAKKNTHNCNFF